MSNFAPIAKGYFPLRIVLAAEPGQGKTMSALKLAVGLADGQFDKVFMIDTDVERGRFYSELFAPNYIMYQSFQPPFTPERAGALIDEAENAGAKVLIYDCCSDLYEGPGGVSTIAEQDKMWTRAKNRWNLKFMQRANHSHLHIIFTASVKTVNLPEKEIAKFRLQNRHRLAAPDVPLICETNFMRPMTLGILCKEQGKDLSIYKTPDAMDSTLEKIVDQLSAPLCEKHGEMLRHWAENRAEFDPEIEKAKTQIKISVEGGMESLKKAWATLSPEMRKKLGSKKGECPAEYKTRAEEYDRMAAPPETAQYDQQPA